MKKSAVLFFIILFSLTAFAQQPKQVKKTTSFAKPAAANVVGEKDELEKAVDQKNASERIMALNKFVINFPNSDEKNRALELIVSARAEIADEKLRLSDTVSGVELFTLAVKDAPSPVSDKLFTEILLQIPTNLFFRGQQAKAIEVARLIEQKIEGNANQLLGLATFYIGTENADEAKRLANKAIAINPNLPAAYQTLGLASRVNFQLEEAANAYAKALELDTNSVVSKRSLAEMKRATGKTDDAIVLYTEILSKNESDAAAQTGLALSLFDAEKRAEAEAETAKLLAQNPTNLPLLVGAAYWYAAHNEGAKAVELAQQALTAEPRYTWAYIALARGLVQQKRPLEAEKALLTAKQYGNFPTLDYEIASVRLAAGFYREAAEELKKSFTVKDGSLETRLGGRVSKKAENFIELLSLERRASIFEMLPADSAENAEKLKSLLEFSKKLESPDANEVIVSEAADEFIKGDDKMKVHRQIFAANRLLENKKAFPKVLELTKAAVSGVDSGLETSTPAAAILADELYDSRRIALIRGQLILVPDVPRQTLSNILRGRIEEISGWTLYQQGKTAEAVIRLKRAVSVLPEKSAWWRVSLWHLGTALDADGRSKEALEAYIKSYRDTEPDVTKRIVIESVYQKLNGSLEGLEEKINAIPVTANVARTPQPQPAETSVAQNLPKEIPVAQPTPAPELKTTPDVSPTPTPELKAIIDNQPTPELKTISELKTMPEPSPELEPTPTPTPSPIVEPSPIPTSEPTAQVVTQEKPTPEQVAEKTPDVLPTPEPKPEDSPAVLPIPEPSAEKKWTVEIKNPALNVAKLATPLFEPIIITVPKTENTKPEGESKENQTEEKPLAKKNNAETIRQRIAPEKKSGLPVEEVAQCKIIVSQESISLINSGGNLGILVGFQEEAVDLKKLTASSSSPDDVQIILEPDIGAQSGRAFFIVKSISSNKGVFSITFDAPCGKKSVSVKVR